MLGEYGLRLQTFNIHALDIPEDDPNRQKLEDAYVRSRELDILGDNYRLVKGMEIMKDVANNQSSGGLAGAGVGLGMGVAAGGVMGEMARGIFGGAAPQQAAPNMQAAGVAGAAAGAAAAGAAAGAAAAGAAAEDPFEKLAKLKKMLDAGLIEQDEYNAAKKNILANM